MSKAKSEKEQFLDDFKKSFRNQYENYKRESKKIDPNRIIEIVNDTIIQIDPNNNLPKKWKIGIFNALEQTSLDVEDIVKDFEYELDLIMNVQEDVEQTMMRRN